MINTPQTRKAMQIALKFTVEDLNKKGMPVHPDTIAAYNEYVGK